LRKLARHDVPKDTDMVGVVASGLTVIASYLMIILLGRGFLGYVANLRYTVPYLIAGAPIMIALAYVLVRGESALTFKQPIIAGLVCFQLLIIAGFEDNLIARVRQALQSGNVLAFPALATTEHYLDYNENVLYGDVGSRISKAQSTIPPGRKVLAWVMTPFHLDYGRNVIVDVDPSGIGKAEAQMPRGIEYFLLEYRGYALYPFETYMLDPSRRQNAELCINFQAQLSNLGQNADVLYDDGQIVVFRVEHRSS